MYRIVLKNVGYDMVNKEFTSNAISMNGAVVDAFTECRTVLGFDKKLSFSVVGEEISITIKGNCVGSLTITKLR